MKIYVIVRTDGWYLGAYDNEEQASIVDTAFKKEEDARYYAKYLAQNEYNLMSSEADSDTTVTIKGTNVCRESVDQVWVQFDVQEITLED